MGTLKLSVPHSLSRDEARERMEKLLDYWVRKFNVKLAWAGHSASVVGKVMGVSLQATLDVGDRSVEGGANDPGMLLRNQARKYLEGKIAAYLDPAKKSDLDRHD